MKWPNINYICNPDTAWKIKYNNNYKSTFKLMASSFTFNQHFQYIINKKHNK